MASYKVTDPTGKIYKVNGPEGATPGEVYAVLQQYLASQGPKTTTAGTALHGAERGALPAVAGFGGMAYGAGLGTAVLPGIGTLIGGGIGAALSTWAASKAQDKALENMPKLAKALGQDKEQREAEEKYHPVAAFGGELLPQLLTLKPNLPAIGKAFKSTANAAEEEIAAIKAARKLHRDAAVMAGVQTGAQDLIEGGGSPTDTVKDVGESALLGAALPDFTKLGHRIMRSGENLGNTLKPPKPVQPAAATQTTETKTADQLPVLPKGPEDDWMGKAQQQPAADQNIGPQLPPTLQASPQAQPQVAQPEDYWMKNQQVEPPVLKSANQPEDQWMGNHGMKYPQPIPLSFEDVAHEQTPKQETATVLPFEKSKKETPTALPFEKGSKQDPDTKENNRKAVFAFMQSNTEGLSKKSIVEATGLGDTEVIGHLGTLKNAGLVKYDTSTKKWVTVKQEGAANGDAGNRPDAGSDAGRTRTRVDVPVQQHAPDAASTNKAVAPRVDDNTADTVGSADSQKQSAFPPLRHPINIDTPPLEMRQRAEQRAAGPAPEVDPLEQQANRLNMALMAGVRAEPSKAAQKIAKQKTMQEGDEEFEAQRSRIVARTIRAFQKGHLDWRQVEEIKAELSTTADFDYLNKMLDAAVLVPKDVYKAKKGKAAVAIPEGTSAEAAKPAVETDEQRQIREYNERRNQEDAAKKNKKPEDDTKFSSPAIGTPVPAKPLSREEVQRIVDEHTRNWSNKPNTWVHQDTSTVPEHMQGDVPSDTKGVHDLRNGQSTIHLFANNLSSREEVIANLFHEGLGHYGLIQKFGNKLKEVMGNIYNTNTRMKTLADQWLKEHDTHPYYQTQSKEDMQARAVEEILAGKSESGAIRDTGVRAAFNKFAALVRGTARRFGAEVKYSDNDVKQILRQAHEKVVGGDVQKYLSGNSISFSATDNFRRWFGNSKVVDERGKPLVLYHGTSKDTDFNKFNVNQRGVWLTTDKSVASSYAISNESSEPKYNPQIRKYEMKNTASRVIPVYAKIENPYHPTPEDMNYLKKAIDYKKAQKDFFSMLRAQGYDGIDMGNGHWVVLKDPTQIKSAIGNSGNYDGLDNRLTFSSPPKTIQAPSTGQRDINQIEESRRAKNEQLYKNPFTKENILVQVHKAFNNYEGRQNTIRVLQNFEQPLKQVQEYLRRSKIATTIYDMARSHSSAMSEYYNKEFQGHREDFNNAVGQFAKKIGMNIQDAMNRLHTYAIALHEPERRWQKFIENVPLKNGDKDKITINGVTATPADHRIAIMEKYYTQKGDITAQGKADKATLEMLAKQHADKDGYSDAKVHPKSVDINDRVYDVLGPYSRQDIKTMQDVYNKDHSEHSTEIDKIFDTMKKIHEKTIELNRKGNYHPQQVSNLISLYGWDHYMPFKGDPNVSDKDNRFERDGKGLSGELNNFAEKAEGRRTDSENPFLQTLADAARSASRAGRNGFTAEVARLIKMGAIKGKLVDTIDFSERLNNLERQDIDAKSIVFNYLQDGSIERYKITDPHMLEAIKGFNGDIGAFWKGLNTITSAIGQAHTRFNIAFPPYNFVRHAITSALFVSAEKNPALAARFLTNITGTILNGGMFKAGKVAAMFHKGDLEGIKNWAKTDDFVNNIHDYLINGGRATYTQAMDIRSNQEQLVKSVGPRGFMTNVDHVKNYFNIWSDMFEFASRSAGYGVYKEHLLSEAKAAGKDVSSQEAINQIKLEASQYVKGLFDYTQVGKYGREAGSVFMFLRPAMTTAVRSIEALSPAFISVDKAVSRMPEILTNPKLIMEKQGLDEAQAKAQAETNIKNFTEDHLKRQKAARLTATGMMGAGYTLYMMALMAGETDDQGRNKVGTDNMELWTRNIRLPAHGLLGKDNDYFQIPWGWGLGAFGALGAQVAGATLGESTLKEAITNMIPVALESYFPIPTPKYSPTDHPLAFAVGSVVPSFARPLIEYGFNVDTFGREIYKNRINQFGDAYSGGENLPELYGAATRMLEDATTTGVLGNLTGGGIRMEPSTLHFFANSYIDGFARLAHNTYGIGLTMAGQKDFDPKRDLGGLMDSFIGKSSSFDAKEFAETEQKIKKQEAILQTYKNNPDMLDRYLDDHPNAIMINNLYNATINGQLKVVREQLKALQADTSQSPKEKSDEIKDLKSQRDWIMRNFLDQVKDYDD